MSLIKTNFVRLKQAAEMLQTDSDTLLIAAYEQRISLYAIVDEYLKTHEGIEWDADKSFCSFAKFHGVGDLLRGGASKIAYAITGEFDPSGRDVEVYGGIDNECGFVDITAHHIYMRREDIEKILEKHESPAAGTVPNATRPQDKSAHTRRTDTLKTIIAALCNKAGIDPKTPGAASDIARMTDSLRTPVSEATIKPLLDALPDAVAKRMK